MADLDFDDVAAGLYSLPLAEFTAARTGYEKQAKAAGDRELADRIRALAKPNVAAWLTNQLVRAHRDELEPLLELGSGLREATRKLAGDQLRELSRQQQKLTYALISQVRELGRSHGQNVTEETARAIEQTLHAALADEAAAAQLLEGRLTAPLQRTGFDDLDGPVASPRPPSSLDAERSVATAAKALEAAAAAAEDAERATADARDEVDQLNEQLAEAKQRLAEAQHLSREAVAAQRSAERALSRAERRAGAAR